VHLVNVYARRRAIKPRIPRAIATPIFAIVARLSRFETFRVTLINETKLQSERGISAPNRFAETIRCRQLARFCPLSGITKLRTYVRNAARIDGYLCARRKRIRAVSVIHLITGQPDPPQRHNAAAAAAAAAARDNSTSGRSRVRAFVRN